MRFDDTFSTNYEYILEKKAIRKCSFVLNLVKMFMNGNGGKFILIFFGSIDFNVLKYT